MVCAFNASLTDPTPGSISAVAVSSFGSSFSTAAVPYALDTATAGAKGACAVLSDVLTSRPTLPSGSVAISNNKPYSAESTPVCTDTSYNFTVGFGPFGDTACSTYTVGGAGQMLCSCSAAIGFG